MHPAVDQPAPRRPAPRTARVLLAGLLCAAALRTGASGAAGAGPAPVQVDCRVRDGHLLAAVDLAPSIDASLEQRLGSGLSSTVRLTVTAAGPGGEAGSAARDFDVLFDPWTETFTVTIRELGSPSRSRQADDWAAVRRLLAAPGPFDLGPLAALPERFTVEVRLELDPVTARQLEKTREQLTHPAGGPGTGGRSLLGTLAALLLRAPPPEATRLRSSTFSRAALPAASP